MSDFSTVRTTAYCDDASVMEGKAKKGILAGNLLACWTQHLNRISELSENQDNGIRRKDYKVVIAIS